MIEAASQSAWSTDRGHPIAAGVIAALRAEKVILPAPAVIERAAMAGRARARKRAADALLAGVSEVQIAKLDQLLTVDPTLKASRFAWLRNAPSSPKADHVGQLIERLRFVRAIGLSADAATRIHDNRFQQLVRGGRISEAHQVGRYAAHRRRAILAANIIDLEVRLTDALLDMTDKLIGGLFARARKAKERRYVASTRDVGRLMRLFHGTIEALATAQQGSGTVLPSWTKSSAGQLLRVRGEVCTLADLAEEDPLLGAADRYRTLRKFAPELLEALNSRRRAATIPLCRRSSCCRTSIAWVSVTFRRTRPCRSARNGSGWSPRTDSRIGAFMRPRCSRRCATGCVPAMSGSNGRLITAALTATCCRRRSSSDRGQTGIACDGRRVAGQAWRRTRSSPAALRPPAPPRRTRRRRIA